MFEICSILDILNILITICCTIWCLNLYLVLIKFFNYIIIEITKSVSILMEIKIKDCKHKTNIIPNNQSDVKTVPPADFSSPSPPPKQPQIYKHY